MGEQGGAPLLSSRRLATLGAQSESDLLSAVHLSRDRDGVRFGGVTRRGEA